jgi:hypothetical protein
MTGEHDSFDTHVYNCWKDLPFIVLLVRDHSYTNTSRAKPTNALAPTCCSLFSSCVCHVPQCAISMVKYGFMFVSTTLLSTRLARGHVSLLISLGWYTIQRTTANRRSCSHGLHVEIEVDVTSPSVMTSYRLFIRVSCSMFYTYLCYLQVYVSSICRSSI